MPIVTLISKRQITVPQELVHRFGLAKGDALLFVLEGDSARVIPIKRKPLLPCGDWSSSPGLFLL